eukprot:284157-Chlamydomonas_euryale.AAC.6
MIVGPSRILKGAARAPFNPTLPTANAAPPALLPLRVRRRRRRRGGGCSVGAASAASMSGRRKQKVCAYWAQRQRNRSASIAWQAAMKY